MTATMMFAMAVEVLRFGNVAACCAPAKFSHCEMALSSISDGMEPESLCLHERNGKVIQIDKGFSLGGRRTIKKAAIRQMRRSWKRTGENALTRPVFH